MTSPVILDGDGLAALYRRHYTPLVRLASMLLDDVGACEEVVQDAFVAMARRRRRIDAGREPAYLRSAVLNGARSRLRRRLVRRGAPVERGSAVPSPEAAVASALDHRPVLDAVRALPRRQREVVVLRYWADLSEAEIADTLGISPGSVKTHAHRALAALAPILEDQK